MNTYSGSRQNHESPLSRGGGECLHILVVDDDEQVRRLFTRFLADAGCRVTTCESAADARHAFGRLPCRVDLLVTDFRMPGGTGEMLAEALWEIVPDLPVIVVSGYVDELAPEWRERRHVRILSKPISRNELCDAVHATLRRADDYELREEWGNRLP